ncbi:MAG: succinylglutamate desuccinylase/aspartoacylase family protein [Candidatus Woesearchaeota archaeon]
MHCKEFYSSLKKAVEKRDDIILEACAVLEYKRGKYGLIKISSECIDANDRILLIRAGIHGDEVSGPLCILHNLGEIFEYAHKNNVKLIIYPLGNPSGFDNGKRYNEDNEKANDDFKRYELEDGTISDDLGSSTSYKKWHWAPLEKLPKETQAMHKELKKLPLRQIKGVLDLHQDYLMPNARPAAYHYSFGNLSIYKGIIGKIRKIVPILADTAINSGFGVQTDSSGKVISSEGESIKTNSNGFIVRYDCTLPDLMRELGAKYCVTAETTGPTPIKIAEQVNLIWIRGIIGLVKPNN